MSKKTIGLILILAGAALAIFGFMHLQDIGTSIGVGDLKVKIEDDGAQAMSYVMMGGGVLAFIFGALMVLRSKN